LSDTILHDPLGRQIVLHDRTWYGHVLPAHPDMDEHRDLANRTITDPLEIRFSAADANCRIFFGVGPRKGIMIVVVADLAGGFVKTAHLIKSAKGAIEWSKPTP
jgi:hypothetical protein